MAELPSALLVDILQKVQTGLVILNDAEEAILVNDWFARAAGIDASQIRGGRLLELFPELRGSRLHDAVRTALHEGLPALLSQSLNSSPFPLYNNPEDGGGERMHQQIQIIPLRLGESQSSHCMIQVVNVSSAVKRESLLREQAEQFKRSLMIDAVTNVFSRFYWEKQIEIEFRRSRRMGETTSIILVDIDYFKLYNDHYGHLAGDLCLARVAKAAAGSLLRPQDFLARYGGEEFVAVLPNTDLDSAEKIAERMRLTVEKLQIPHARSHAADMVTISLGVCSRSGHAENVESLLMKADAALYQAKSRGRNRVVCST